MPAPFHSRDDGFGRVAVSDRGVSEGKGRAPKKVCIHVPFSARRASGSVKERGLTRRLFAWNQHGLQARPFDAPYSFCLISPPLALLFRHSGFGADPLRDTTLEVTGYLGSALALRSDPQ